MLDIWLWFYYYRYIAKYIWWNILFRALGIPGKVRVQLASASFRMVSGSPKKLTVKIKV